MCSAPPACRQANAQLRGISRTARRNSPFSADLNKNEVSERLKRCSSTAPGPDNIRYKSGKSSTQAATCSLPFSMPSNNNSTLQRLAPLNDSAHPQKGALEEFWQTDWRCGQLPSTESARPKRTLCLSTVARNIISCSRAFFRMPAESEMKVPSRSDQTNAFGSIPHEVIFRSLKWSGLDNTTATPSDYCTTTTRPKHGRHTGGLTDDITIRTGEEKIQIIKISQTHPIDHFG
ncbi:hypothetical protein niasHT_008660 [Heterodera trifolii]|uniref:Uncharacterized protein n=1 Tax=Heterodera trifolii TaxID=157864 RepID=A0ABD2LWZ6_9BILA